MPPASCSVRCCPRCVPVRRDTTPSVRQTPSRDNTFWGRSVTFDTHVNRSHSKKKGLIGKQHLVGRKFAQKINKKERSELHRFYFAAPKGFHLRVPRPIFSRSRLELLDLLHPGVISKPTSRICAPPRLQSLLLVGQVLLCINNHDRQTRKPTALQQHTLSPRALSPILDFFPLWPATPGFLVYDRTSVCIDLVPVNSVTGGALSLRESPGFRTPTSTSPRKLSMSF